MKSMVIRTIIILCVLRARPPQFHFLTFQSDIFKILDIYRMDYVRRSSLILLYTHVYDILYNARFLPIFTDDY